MKIIVYAALWQRHKIFECFKQGIKRLQQIEDFQVVVVGSENEVSAELCTEYIYVESPNKPLGQKRNNGLQVIKEMEFDYLFFLSGDHIIDNSLFEKNMRYMYQGVDHIAIRDGYFYDTERKKLWYSQYTDARTQGMGRCLSRKVIEKLDFELWHSGQTIRMDKSMEYRISTVEHTSVVYSLAEDNFCMDIKNGEVLNPIGALPNREEVGIKTLTKYLPQEEVTAILSL